jgi:hypothetical protein
VVAQITNRIAQMLPTFPSEVQSAWNLTMSRRVGYVPSGALPSLTTP